MEFPVLDTCNGFVVVGHLFYGWRLALRRDFLNASDLSTQLRRDPSHRVEQVEDYLMTYGRHSDFCAAADELTNHMGACERLSGTGWSLHGKHRPVEFWCYADGELQCRLVDT